MHMVAETCIAKCLYVTQV